MAGSTADCVGAAQGPSVLLTHGTTDGLGPFEGSAVARDIIVAEWGMGEPTTLSADETHTWSGYGNEAGTRFEFLEHDWETSFMLGSNALAGHCVPGSDAFLGCGADNPVVWGDALIAFYLAHPR